jgi:hypothetical protein
MSTPACELLGMLMALAVPSSDACIALTTVETLRHAVGSCYFSENCTPFQLLPSLTFPGRLSTCDQQESHVHPLHVSSEKSAHCVQS